MKPMHCCCCCCRDIDGHGSHTASTAAGNYGDTSDEAPAGALLSGVAPRARLAIYKVWELDRMQGKVMHDDRYLLISPVPVFFCVRTLNPAP
jgi:hypothetical protein